MNKKKSNLVMLILVLAIIGVIWAIIYARESIEDKEVMKCIAENSRLYVSKTCSFCAQQKLILGDSVGYFDIIDCIDDTQKCIDEGIINGGKYKIPAWIINGEIYAGVYNIEQLKNLTGC